MALEFDYIIVGGGSAGCVLADKLSACGNYQVCLLEAGPHDNHWMTKIPLAVVTLMRSKKRNWQFYSEPEPHLNNRRIFNPRGKTLGGSSSINAMLYVRGQKEDYDHWHALGNHGWSYQDVLHYFKAMQHQERGKSIYHGENGPLNVADSRAKPAINQYFLDAAQNLGIPFNQDFNGDVQEGVGYYQVTQKNGMRCSAATAFLEPSKTRNNLSILTNVIVHKVIIEHGEAKGITCTYQGEEQEFIAHKEVIVSAGAFNSPQLLMLSGIGDPKELEQHDIPLKHALTGVGKNLQDHVDILSVFELNYHQLLAYRFRSLLWSCKESIKYLINRTGILASPVAETGGFIKTKNTESRPDIQLHFIPAAMDDHGRNDGMLLKYGSALHACLLRPKSRGYVALHSASPLQKPKVLLNMMSDEDDVQRMIEAVKISRAIFNQSPMKNLLSKEIFPGEQTQTDDEIEAFIRQKANTIYHPVGTCKMGQDEEAVVDEQLRVRGIQRLRVVDASIMPTIVSGNTNAPTMMIAAKAADMILTSNNTKN
ncbi:GMC family oxidoreductase [Thalassotalea fusca]